MYRVKLLLVNGILFVASQLTHAQVQFDFMQQHSYADMHYAQTKQSTKATSKSTTANKTPPQKGMLPLAKKENDGGPSKEVLAKRKLLKEAPIHRQRAWLYSAILPGLGQAYNDQYWKIGMFYGGFALTLGLARFHHTEYLDARRRLIDQQEAKNKKNNQDLPKYSGVSLENEVQTQKRERNLYLGIAALWYVVNIFDAYVYGSLKTFDVSDNLEVVFAPQTEVTATAEPTIGMGLSLRLKS